MLRVAALLAVVLSAAAASASAARQQTPEPVPAIELTVPADVASVQTVSEALSTFGQKVTACVDGGRALESCRCSAPQELANLKLRFETVIKQHPAWKDQVVSYQYIDKQGRNMSGVLALNTLRRQLEMLRCE